MFSSLLEIIGLLLLLAVPVFSAITLRRPEILEIPRKVLYASAVFSSWLLAILIAAIELLVQRKVGGLGLPHAKGLAQWTVLITGISFGAMLVEVVLQKFGLWPDDPPLVRRLMPETPEEKLWCIFLLAPTAALCEEFVYRGFLLSVLRALLGSTGWAVAIASAAFGLAHPYQGWRGMVRAALLGALLAWPVLRLGSLVPSIAAHFLIDAVSLGWLGPAMLRRESQ
ncbi:MAG TPA: CPBP family intramembrane glutamic endopeptidase [Terriglobia bacterium]|nr:CPBP family intramembrane glutamic endopeptidase [Terriglobia bacterium]